jgi:hypothetical protein
MSGGQTSTVCEELSWLAELSRMKHPREQKIGHSMSRIYGHPHSVRCVVIT